MINLNRKGVTRLVFEFDNFVIKIPNFTYSWQHFLKGILANIQEYTTWSWSKDELLCPVLWCSWGGWFLIMKKAKTYSFDEWDNIEVDISNHIKYFPGDDTMSNYGYLNDKLVKIDYGQ